MEPQRSAQTSRVSPYRAQKSDPVPPRCWLTRAAMSEVTPTYMIPR